MSSIKLFKEDLHRGENIELMKKVSNQNKNLKKRFDNEVISKQNTQTSLKEIYQPIIDSQQLATTKISEQTIKSDTLFRELLLDLRGKHDNTSMLLTNIIEGLTKSSEEIQNQGLSIISAIAKQPLLSELIHKLNNYPGLVNKIMNSGSIKNINLEDEKVLEPLKHLNDADLKTLINYYILEGKMRAEVSASRESESGESASYLSLDESGASLPGNVETNFQERPTGSHAYSIIMNNLKKRKEGLKKVNKDGSPIFYLDRNIVKLEDKNVTFKGNNIKIKDKEYVLTDGLELLLNRVIINSINKKQITENDRDNHKIIITDIHQKVGHGLSKTIILPDNVEELKNKLIILLGEYSAGNRDLFNEINAILDILYKKRIISKVQLKKVLHSIQY